MPIWQIGRPTYFRFDTIVLPTDDQITLQNNDTIALKIDDPIA